MVLVEGTEQKHPCELLIIAAGRACASEVDAYLMGSRRQPEWSVRVHNGDRVLAFKIIGNSSAGVMVHSG